MKMFSRMMKFAGVCALQVTLIGCNGQDSGSTSSISTASGAASSSASSTTSSALKLNAESSSSQPLAFDPSVYSGTEVQLSVSGGTSPYSYAVSGCDSTVDASSGLFTAGSAGTACEITVTDAAGATAVLDVNVVAAPSASTTSSARSTPTPAATPGLKAANFETYAGASFTLPVFGGTAPYTYSVTGCDSTIDASSGAFIAASDVSTCSVVVTDADSASITDVINIVSLAAFNQAVSQAQNQGGRGNDNSSSGASGSQGRLLAALPSTEILEGASVQVAVRGGKSPYAYAVSGCDSTIDANSGLFTAGGDASSCVITVTDAGSRSASVNLNVVAAGAIASHALKVARDSVSIPVGHSRQMSAVGGILSYSFAVSGCDSTISSSGVFTAASDASTCSVAITDAAGSSVSISVNVR